MLVSLPWLQEFVPYEGTAQALGDSLTMLGLELDGIIRPFESISGIVIGHVVECDPHPEASKLSVCKVDVGSEVLDIVCGAPNVRKGLKVAVIKVGDTLPNGTLIKSAVLRGINSNGMICSEAELGLSDEADGIMELASNLNPGDKFVDALKLDQEVLDISITPNRGDCLSILGVAREAAIAFNLPLTMPAVNLKESSHEAASEIQVNIEVPDLCHMYLGRIIDNAPAKKSPDWMRFRLHAVGLRAVSNHVDVTNYILMELGRPLHAFDLETIEDRKIIVKMAHDGDLFTSLDNQERKLLHSDITINDSKRIVGLGGIMGGLNTEITESSRRVFLECAVFHPSSIRKTARRLALHSDSSYRFERGVDQVASVYGINRAAALIAELSGGEVLKGIVTAEPHPWQPKTLRLRKSRIYSLLGMDFTPDFCADTLTKLGCKVQSTTPDPVTDPTNPEVWEVVPPSHRPDLTREVDLIEEVIRVYGIDKVPPALPVVRQILEEAGKPEPAHVFRMRLKHWGAGLGLNEAVNYSFVGHKEMDFIGLPKEGRISIINPLSDEQDVLRTHLIPGLLQNLRTNISQGTQGLRFFEIATAFTANPDSETTADESARLAIMLYGNRFDGSWPQVQAQHDYQDLKGIIEHLCAYLHLPAPQMEQQTVVPWLAPCVAISTGGTAIGYAGKVRTDLADHYHAKRPVWTAELNLDILYTLHLEQKIQFKSLDLFPPVRRDITVIATPEVKVEAITSAVHSLKIPTLQEVTLIDLFVPQNSEERHLTFRFTFRDKVRTLKDGEVDKHRNSIAAALEKQLGVRI